MVPCVVAQALSRRRLQSEAGAGPSQRPAPVTGWRGAPAPVRGRRRPQSGRQWIIASSYCSCLATRHSSTLLSASLFSAILNRRGGWLPTLAGFTLGAIAEPLLGACSAPLGAMLGCHCHCWGPLVGAIIGCHCRGAMQWVPLLRCHCGGNAIARCHCRMLASRWVPLLGAIARSHCLGAIVRRHCWVPLLVSHCWVPLWGAMAGCHCWCHCCVPLRETIARKN